MSKECEDLIEKLKSKNAKLKVVLVVLVLASMFAIIATRKHFIKKKLKPDPSGLYSIEEIDAEVKKREFDISVLNEDINRLKSRRREVVLRKERWKTRRERQERIDSLNQVLLMDSLEREVKKL